MFGQFFVEPEPDVLLEPEEEPEEPDEPELVLPDPEFPVLVDGVVVDGVVVEEPELDEFEVAVAPELPVVLEVVAALATRAPPARRPEASAPVASAVRRRIFMGGRPFVCVLHPPIRAGTAQAAPGTCGWAQNHVGAWKESLDDQVTIHRNAGVTCPRAPGSAAARSACRRGSSGGWSAGSG